MMQQNQSNPPQAKLNHHADTCVLPEPENAPVNKSSISTENIYDQYVPELLASYSAIGGLNNRDAHNMPSTRAVGQVCHDLLQLLFPGFHDDDAVHHGTLAELTGAR